VDEVTNQNRKSGKNMKKIALGFINGSCEIYNCKKHVYEKYNGEFCVLTTHSNYSGVHFLSLNEYNAYFLDHFNFPLEDSWNYLKKYNMSLIIYDNENAIGSKVKENAEKFIEYLESFKVMRKLVDSWN